MLVITVFRDDSRVDETVERQGIGRIRYPLIADFSYVNITEETVTDLNSETMRIHFHDFSCDKITHTDGVVFLVKHSVLKDVWRKFYMFKIVAFRSV